MKSVRVNIPVFRYSSNAIKTKTVIYICLFLKETWLTIAIKKFRHTVITLQSSKKCQKTDAAEEKGLQTSIIPMDICSSDQFHRCRVPYNIGFRHSKIHELSTSGHFEVTQNIKTHNHRLQFCYEVAVSNTFHCKLSRGMCTVKHLMVVSVTRVCSLQSQNPAKLGFYLIHH